MNFLPNLSGLSLSRQDAQAIDASAEETFSSDIVGYNEWLDKCVALHDTLVAAGVPKNPDCGKAPPLGAGNRRKRKDDTPTVECNADGYKMGVDMVGFGARAFPEGFPEGVDNWAHIEGDDFASKLRFVQMMQRSRELLNPDTDLCTYGKNDANQIRVDLYTKADNGDLVLREESDINASTEFVHELVSTSEWVYYHPTHAGMVWLHTVNSAEQAAQLHLMWPPPYGADKYMYLPLVCAENKLPGGGIGLMKEVAKLCNLLGIRTLVFSALPHVVWYYFRQLTRAVFINDSWAEVDVAAWSSERPFIEPMSGAQADYLRVNFTPRRTRLQPPPPAQPAQPAV